MHAFLMPEVGEITSVDKTYRGEAMMQKNTIHYTEAMSLMTPRRSKPHQRTKRHLGCGSVQKLLRKRSLEDKQSKFINECTHIHARMHGCPA